MKYTLKLSGQHHADLKSHLLQDANEAAALLLCGRCVTDSQTILIGQKVVLVPLEACVERHPDYLHWRTEAVEFAFEEAAAQNLSVLKIHSHPGGYASFSRTDDASDKDLFPSLYGWTNGPHASAVMLPDGSIFGRHVSDKGRFVPIRRVAVAGTTFRYGMTEFTVTKSRRAPIGMPELLVPQRRFCSSGSKSPWWDAPALAQW